MGCEGERRVGGWSLGSGAGPGADGLSLRDFPGPGSSRVSRLQETGAQPCPAPCKQAGDRGPSFPAICSLYGTLTDTVCTCVFSPRESCRWNSQEERGPRKSANFLSADPKITDAASWSRRGDLGSAPHGPGAPEAAHRISLGSPAPQARGAGTPRALCSEHLGRLEARTGSLPSRIMEEETEVHRVRGTHPRANGKVVPELGLKPGPPGPPKHQVCGWSAPRPGPAPWRLCVGLTDREVQQCTLVRGRRSSSGACLQGL